eukprot:Pgem_evm1s17530
MSRDISYTDLLSIRINSLNVKNYDIHSPVNGNNSYLPLTYTAGRYDNDLRTCYITQERKLML